MGLEITKIEEKINRVELGSIEVSDSVGGAGYRNLSEMLEFGKMMATTSIGVPRHLRGEVGGCVRIVMQALEWRMSPFAVADKSYVVNDKIAYEAQLLHAVVESRAPLQKRLRFDFEGDGENRVCVVTGLLKGELDPLVYRSPAFGKITPKNSPLWKSDADQQQAYFSVRAWARRYVPDVLLGIYSRDELEDAGDHTGPNKAKDVTPKSGLATRLKGNKGTGFDAGAVEAETTTIAAQAAKPIGDDAAKASGGEAATSPDDPPPLATDAPMDVADAYAAGQKKKADGKALDIPVGLPEPQRDAMAAGYEAGE